MVSKFRHFGKDKNPPVYANCASVSTDSIKKVMKDNEKKNLEFSSSTTGQA